MDGPNIIFLCGPHSSGKTTILMRLFQEGIFSAWGPEIGKELFYQRRLTTVIQDAEYEFEVSELELERDLKYEHEKGLIGIESWHPGNLAYALVRNPSIVPQLSQKMKESPLLSEAHGICLCIPPGTIFERTRTFRNNRSWAAEFYTKIQNNLSLCFQYLGLENRVETVDANRDLDVVLEDVRKILKSLSQCKKIV